MMYIVSKNSPALPLGFPLLRPPPSFLSFPDLQHVLGIIFSCLLLPTLPLPHLFHIPFTLLLNLLSSFFTHVNHLLLLATQLSHLGSDLSSCKAKQTYKACSSCNTMQIKRLNTYLSEGICSRTVEPQTPLSVSEPVLFTTSGLLVPWIASVFAMMQGRLCHLLNYSIHSGAYS